MLCNCMIDVDVQMPTEQLTFDEEGFVICPFHQVRRYGWRDAGGRDHSLDGYNDLDIERFQLWSNPLPSHSFDAKKPDQDLRDNRDPLTIELWDDSFRGSYAESEAAYQSEEFEEAALQARVRLDLRDKRDVPLHDGRPVEDLGMTLSEFRQAMDEVAASKNGGK